MGRAVTASDRGSFALVSYASGKLGTYLDDLRHTLCGLDDSQAHVTLLPPRPLQTDLHETSRKVKSILSGFTPFDIELTNVRRFASTKVVYLEIGAGNHRIREIHTALNSGELSFEEEFEFQPHVTLTGRPSLGQSEDWLRRAESHWAALVHPRGFRVEEIVFLWRSPIGEWRRQWSVPLAERTARTAAVSMMSSLAPKF